MDKTAYYRLGSLTAIVDVNGSASAALESCAGVTVHQCLRAADGIAARIIDLYSVKPADQATLQAAASATGGRLVTAEDRYLPGRPRCRRARGPRRDRPAAASPGSARPAACPGSGTPDVLMEAAGISASRIADAARALVKD